MAKTTIDTYIWSDNFERNILLRHDIVITEKCGKPLSVTFQGSRAGLRCNVG